MNSLKHIYIWRLYLHQMDSRTLLACGVRKEQGRKGRVEADRRRGKKLYNEIHAY